MGFYGNITNASRTTFQFDKIYPSRTEMENSASSDGVYNGRYVLVEYDQELNQELYKTTYIIVKDKGADEYKIYYSAKTELVPPVNVNNDTLFNYSISEKADFYNYFNGVIEQQAVKSNELNDKMFLFERGHVYRILNDEPFFVKFYKDGSYSRINFTEFKNLHIEYFNSSWTTETEQYILNQTDAYYSSKSIPLVYISNGICYYTNSQLFNDREDASLPAIVKAGRQYLYNVDEQFWTIGPETWSEGEDENMVEYPKVQQYLEDNDPYTYNFNQDKKKFGASRGYDSTVWQKVFVDGVEKYVMIAELNTVVPTFGITADPPTLLPINPHWGADSTNVYYTLHWQPSWGVRFKAADSKLTIPTLNVDGTIMTIDGSSGPIQGQFQTLLRDVGKDAINYPSDVEVTLSHTFDDLNAVEPSEKRKTLYYDSLTGTWSDDNSKTVPAAIYFNKDGFDSDVIAYSDDLINEDINHNRYNSKIASTLWPNRDIISMTPTGLSGNIYNKHDGTFTKSTQVDTQEVSIMLPSVGNIIAKVWDMVYGGRNTSDVIRRTNLRNKDIKWENGAAYLQRQGLRLKGTDGNQYNTAAVETLAGCINTAHDLFGMIIQEYDSFDDATQSFINGSTTPTLLDSVNEDRIFFVRDVSKYYRKHKTYDYIPLPDSEYIFTQVDQSIEYLDNDIIHNGNYWIYQNGTYILVPQNHTYDPNVQYYYRQTKRDNEFKEIDLTGKIFRSFPYSPYLWYEDDSIVIPNNEDHKKSNFISEDSYREGKTYCKVVVSEATISDAYVRNKYYFKDKYGTFHLDTNAEPIRYHKVDNSREFTGTQEANNNRVKNGNYYLYQHDDNGIFDYVNVQALEDHEYNENNSYYWEVRQHFDINDQNFRQTLQEANRQGIYAPGIWYYKNPTTGSYVVDNTVNGSDITAAWNVFWANATEEEKQGLSQNEPLCYTLTPQLIVEDNANVGTVVTYVQVIDWEQVTDTQDNPVAPGRRVTEQNYTPNTYYTHRIENGEDKYDPCTEDSFDPEKIYFVRIVRWEQQQISSTTAIINTDEPITLRSLARYRDNTYFIKNHDPNDYHKILSYIPVTLQYLLQMGGKLNDSQSEPIYVLGEYGNSSDPIYQLYNHIDGLEYKALDDQIMEDRLRTTEGSQYYQEDYNWIIKDAGQFYKPGLYHYQMESGSYILDHRSTYDPDLTYYKIERVEYPENGIVYLQSGEYYYKDSNEYIPINNENFNNNNLSVINNGVYIKDGLYVYEDTTENPDSRLKKGTEWNINSKVVPDSITLATREPRYEIKEIEGYAVDSTTINGILLKTYQTLESNDPYTRDVKTVGGALNKVQDLIARFSNMVSRQITIIDDVGRVHSVPVVTDQTASHNQLKGLETRYTDYVKGDKYPQANSLADMKKQWLTVNIDGNISSPKISIHHNFQPVANGTLSNINLNDLVNGNVQDRLNLQIPIVDAMGHIVGNNSQAVILPYGFKVVSIDTGGAEPFTVTATNPQDTFNLNLDGMNVSVENGELSIAPISNYGTISTIIPNNLTDNSCTMGTATSVNAEEAGDEFSFQPGNRYITMQLSGQTLTIGHGSPGTAYISSGDNPPSPGNGNLGVISPAMQTENIYQYSVVSLDWDSYVSGVYWIQSGANYIQATGTFDPALTYYTRTNVGQTRNKFKVPYIQIDKVGHVTTLSEHYVELQGFEVENGRDSGYGSAPTSVAYHLDFGPIINNGVDTGQDRLWLKTYTFGEMALGVNQGTINTENSPNLYDMLFNPYYDYENSTWLNNDNTQAFNNYSTTGLNELPLDRDYLQLKWKLDHTSTYRGDSQLWQILNVITDRTVWLTQLSQNLKQSVTNAASNTVYYNEEKTEITLQELAQRVALIEDTLKQLVTVDESTNSLVVLSSEELDEIFAWSDDDTIDESFEEGGEEEESYEEMPVLGG